MDRIGEIDIAVVLGSGLSKIFGSSQGFNQVSYDEIGMPVAALDGHAGHALVGRLHGKRVLLFAGRVHGYQGFEARDVTRNIAIAGDRGARTVILTNAAGGLNPAFAVGDLMLIADHINLTGSNPLTASGARNPFVNMTDAYSSRLRDLARGIDSELREGIYAGLAGPSYETPAEARYLRLIGADAVGMSTVLETIAARARNMDVLGMSMITNAVAAADATHSEVTGAAQMAAPRVRALIEGLIERI